MHLDFRVRCSGMATTPYYLEYLDARGHVTSVRPASAEEWTLYRLALSRLA